MDALATSPPFDFAAARKNLLGQFPARKRFMNRELSWLDFNNRVLEEALDPTIPVLERLKFLAIFASNLDEFFMVRVAFVRRAMEAGLKRRGADGLRAADVMERIAERVHEAHESIGRCYRESILPALEAAGVRIVSDLNASKEQREFALRHFKSNLQALLTPIVLDVTHPFPELENQALYFVIELKRTGTKANGIVLLRIPTHVVTRFVRIPASDNTASVMMVDDIIRLSLPELFSADEVLECYQVKIVRDSELELDEVGSVDLLKSIVRGLERRKRGPTTRFLYDPAMPVYIIKRFAKHLKLHRKNMFPGARYHSFSDMMQVPSVVERPDLMYPPMPPINVAALESAKTIIDVVRRQDVLLHHPYQNFSYVARFFEEAAADDATLEMKATLYRVSSDSRIAAALARAARNGKKVTVLVELKARFDEERNIGWAHALAESGATVIYGVKGLKTHCKMVLVVRKEDGGLRRYCHLSTGNYNDRTARLYCDIGLLTAQPEITDDVAHIFNRLTADAPLKDIKHLLVAPETLRLEFTRRIRREAENVLAGKPGGIIAKMNSLVDPDIIDELYIAARAGVPIRLIVRGICCLRPGVPGLSENVEVTSIVDRFLEHARIYRFENGGQPELYLSSADWMPRNLNNRIEVAFPVLDARVAAQVEEVLRLQLSDTVKARILHPDGSNHRRSGAQSARSQFVLYEHVRPLSV
ncbi:MAG: polyphosphate kinase 1 [Bacteroidota bacterium]